MKTIKQFLTILLLLCATLSISAQCGVEASNDQSITCEGSAQLNAVSLSNGVWSALNPGFTTTLNSICFVTDSIGYTAGVGGLIYKTTDGGLNWISQNSGTTNQIYSIKFFDEYNGYAVGLQGTVLKTINGGSNWTLLNAGITNSIRSIFLKSANIIYITGSGGIVMKSDDGGINWMTLFIDPSKSFYDISISSTGIGYVCGTFGAIYKTFNGGENWDPQIYMSSISLNSISIVTDNIAIAVGNNGTILKSTEDGMTWFKIGNDTIYERYEEMNGILTGINGHSIARSTLKMVQFTSSNIGYISGYDGLLNKAFILKTIDGGNTWLEVASFVSYKFFSGYFLNSNTGYACGTSGSIAKLTAAQSTTAESYSWYPTTGLSNPNIANPVASPTFSTMYTVTRTDSICTSKDSVMIYVDPLSIDAGSNKKIGCEGGVQLDSIRSNFAGDGKLKYKWTPSTGLNSDTIPNPIATVTTNTNYTITITTPGGCIASAVVTVNVSPLTLNAGADKTIVCGAQTQLSATTNYTGNSPLHYKWTPSLGLSNDTIANPIASNTTKTTTYTLTVNSSSGCTATDKIVIYVNPLTIDAGTDKTANCGNLVQLGVVSTNYNGTGQLKYKWTPATGLDNDTISNPMATAGNRTYTVTVTSPTGCSASDNVMLTVIPMDKPAINYVGINEDNKNILVWTKQTNGLINSFNIYRETNVTNSFSKIGSVAFASEARYVDTLSMPDVQSNKYKISVVDNCGNETALSDQHKTMHLSINKGINNIWNLIWEAYEGYPVSTYNIYRGTSASNIQIIGSLSGSNTQFTDYTAPTGYVYYQIEALSAGAVTIPQNKQAVRQASETSFSSRSNIATNKGGADGIIQIKDFPELISIYPNPASTRIEVNIHANLNSGMKIRIYNSTGLLVIDQDLYENKQIIDLGMLNNGVYILSVLSDKFIANQKLIIEK